LFTRPPASTPPTLSLHDALPIWPGEAVRCTAAPDDLFVAIGLADLPAAGETVSVEVGFEDLETGTLRQTSADSVPVDAVRRESVDRKSTRLNSSHVKISYAVFCL